MPTTGKQAKGKTFTFQNIPEKDAAAYSCGVLDALAKLGIDWDYDETSPPNKKGECTFKVVGVVE